MSFWILVAQSPAVLIDIASVLCFHTAVFVLIGTSPPVWGEVRGLPAATGTKQNQGRGVGA